MENPYASPTAVQEEELEAVGPFAPRRERYAQLGEAMVAWERLRVWYNVVLAATALVALLFVAFWSPNVLFKLIARRAPDMVVAAIGANVCFFAAHVLEGYITWCLGPVPWLRRVIFFVGTAGAMLLTLCVIMFLALEVSGFELPAPD